MKVNKEHDVWWSFGTSKLVFLLVVPMGLLMFAIVTDMRSQRELQNILYMMENFQYVDTITINDFSQVCRIDKQNDLFDEVKSCLHPFHPTAGGIGYNKKRELQRQASEQFAEITFYKNHERLFSL